MLKLIWGYICGVYKPEHWRHVCSRCGFSGQVHYTGMFFPCVRFKPVKKASEK